MELAQRGLGRGRAWMAVVVAVIVTMAGFSHEARAQAPDAPGAGGSDGQAPDGSDGPRWPGRAGGHGGMMMMGGGGRGGWGGHQGWGRGGHMEPPTIESRVRMMTKRLGLTPEQATKLREVFTKSDADRHTLMEKERAARNEFREQIDMVRTRTEAGITALLTPDQRKKLEERPTPPAGMPGRGMQRHGPTPEPSGR